jgi:hypothetical protein
MAGATIGGGTSIGSASLSTGSMSRAPIWWADDPAVVGRYAAVRYGPWWAWAARRPGGRVRRSAATR